MILMRHGQAEEGSIDSERKLTKQGQLDVTRMGDFISRTGWTITDIRHSPLVRARQTAESLLNGLGTQEPKLINEPMLAPGFDCQTTSRLAENYQASDASIWVFHMPDIAILAGFFLNFVSGQFYISPGTSIALNLNPQNFQSVSMIWSLPADFL